MRIRVPPDDLDVGETGDTELFQEGPAFLSPRDSTEPVFRAELKLGRQRCPERELRREQESTWPHYAYCNWADKRRRGETVTDAQQSDSSAGRHLERRPGYGWSPTVPKDGSG